MPKTKKQNPEVEKILKEIDEEIKTKEKSTPTLNVWDIPKIDVHVHMGLEPEGDKFTPSQLSKNMKKYNIRKAVIFPFNTKPKDGFKKANDMIYRLQKKYDPLIGFSRIDPTHPDWEREMERAIKLDMKGFKFHPFAQKFECDEIGPCYEKAVELNLPVLIHSAHKKGKYIDQLKEIIPSYPELVLILAHAGLTEQSDAIRMCNELKNVYMEMSINKKHRVEVLNLMVDDDKMMFGSDSPYGGMKKTIERMDIDWRADQRMKKVFYENAKRVLGI